MYRLKLKGSTSPVKSKKKSDQNLRKVVLKKNVLTNAKKAVHQENLRDQFVAAHAADVGTAKVTPRPSISSLVVNKWTVANKSPQTVPATQTSTPSGGPMIKNVNINGRIIPMKVLKIIPANQVQVEIGTKSVNKNGTSDSAEQKDLREQVKRITDQNAQILARINRPKSVIARLREMKDVDEFEEKIDTNTKKHHLANFLRKRITDKANAVMDIIEMFFSEELVSKFNSNGLRKKRSFKKLHLNTVIRVVSGLDEKPYYLELARCIHTLTARYNRAQKKKLNV